MISRLAHRFIGLVALAAVGSTPCLAAAADGTIRPGDSQASCTSLSAEYNDLSERLTVIDTEIDANRDRNAGLGAASMITSVLGGISSVVGAAVKGATNLATGESTQTTYQDQARLSARRERVAWLLNEKNCPVHKG